jgi:hypothetical protein
MPKTGATPTAVSMTKWRVGKDPKSGNVTVEMTFSDPTEARAWSIWLMDREAAATAATATAEPWPA